MFSPGKPHAAAKESDGVPRWFFSKVSLALALLGASVPGCSSPNHVAGTPAQGKAAAVASMGATNFAEFQKTVQPFFAAHCYECHGSKDTEGGVRLDTFTDEATLAKGLPTLDRALKMLAARKMPPKSETRPTEDEYHMATAWIESYSNKYYLSGPIDPGRVTIHRLNRAEYNNTIRDLLAIDFKPADAFPVDDAGYGFDNNGDVLSIAPVLLEKYITAASLSLKKAVFAEPVRPPPVKTWDAATAEGDFPKSDPKAVVNNRNGSGGRAPPNPVGRVFQYYGNIYADYDFPMDGDYIFDCRAYGVAGTDGMPKMAFYVDDQQVGKNPIQVGGGQDNARVFATQPTHVTAGKHRIYLSFRTDTTQDEYVAALAAAAAAPPPVAVSNPPAVNAAAPAAVAASTPAAAPAPAAVAVSTPAAAPAAVAVSTPAAVNAVAAVPPTVVAVAPTPATAQSASASTAAATAATTIVAASGAGGAMPATPAANVPPVRFVRPPPPKSVTGKATLAVIYFEVQGPQAVTPDRMPESYHRVMVAQPSATMTKAQAAEKIIPKCATRANSRPVTEDEVTSLMAMWSAMDKDNRSLEDSMSVVLQAVLASPNFLFRIEQDPQPGETGNIHTLNEYELASRLSYFLWSSMPDDELFNLAAKGQLRANLDAQVVRMLKDPKSEALVDNFAGQWLRLRQVENVSPDPKLYPAFDQELREDMLTETQKFFLSIKDEDRDIMDFINADYSFVNERLAKFYGLDGITGDAFQRVTFPKDSPRGGLLTQASILTLTSYNNRTSPVQRGKWVLENLLDSAPPPPPPNVPVLDSEKQLTGTLRQQMEQHRANPTCAACHERMDAIGFSLENFDAIGAWRTKDASDVVIDASGALPDGTTFNGASQLKQILMLQKDQFCRCMADKMLIYAIGRGTEPSDKRTIANIVTETQQNGDKFSSLVKAIVHSDAFQKRSGLPPADPTTLVNKSKSGEL